MAINPPLSISCDECSLRCSVACDDCIVTFVLESDENQHNPGQALVLDLEQERVMRMMTQVGLVPQLRFNGRLDAAG